MQGLADGVAPGNLPRVTGRMRAFMEERVSEERTRNATQLAEVLGAHFGPKVTPEAILQHLLSMGYSWKRTRHAPAKGPDPEEEGEARGELDRGSLRR